MFANKDSVFVLAYSIMMLNTDLHNDQNKKKMTLNVRRPVTVTYITYVA